MDKKLLAFKQSVAEVGKVLAKNFKIFPLLEGSKHPVHKGSFKNATNDIAQIEQWALELPGIINWGIATGKTNNLLVLDIDLPKKRGYSFADAYDEATSKLGIDPLFSQHPVVKTPSGAVHIYLWLDSNSPEYSSTSGSNIFGSGILYDVRAEGGYVVAPTSFYKEEGSPSKRYRIDGDEYPITDPNFLHPLVRFSPDTAPFTDEGKVFFEKIIKKTSNPVTFDIINDSSRNTPRSTTYKTAAEEAGIKWALEQLNSIPTPVPDTGSNWHDTVVRVFYFLAKMVRTSAYFLTEEDVLANIIPRVPLWDKPGAESEVLQTWKGILETCHKENLYLELKSDKPAHLSIDELKNRVTEPNLWVKFENPRITLRELARELKATNIPPEVAHSFLYESKANKTGAPVWGIIHQIFFTETESVSPVGSETSTLLTDAERDFISDTVTFMDFYCEESIKASGNVRANLPLARANALHLLSLCLGNLITWNDPQQGVQFYTINISRTSSGKGLSAKLFRRFLDEIFRYSPDDNPILGDDPSTQAFQQALIERDGKPALYLVDEATSTLKGLSHDTSAQKGYQRGLFDIILKANDGYIDSALRMEATRKGKHKGEDDEYIGEEETRVNIPVNLNALFQLTPTSAYDALSKAHLTNGFVGRVLFVVGDAPTFTEETFTPKNPKPGSFIEGTPATVVALSRFLADLREQLSGGGKKIIYFTEESAVRFGRAGMAVLKQLGSEHEGLASRFMLNIQKIAILNAVASGRDTVLLADTLIALNFAEEFLKNLLHVVDRIGLSDHAVLAEEIRKYVEKEPREEQALRADPRFNKFHHRLVTDALYGLTLSGAIIKEAPNSEGKIFYTAKTGKVEDR